MRKHIVLFFTAVFLFLAAPLAARAQNPLFLPQKPKEEEKTVNFSELFYQLPEDVQEELIIEAKQVELDCSIRGLYSSYHDCGCIAIKYIDQRILKGPEARADEIYEGINSRECRSIAGIAGYSYSQCARHMINNTKGDSVCSCAANKIAAVLYDAEVITSKVIRRVSAKAFGECGMHE